jgi:hypothetical protein
MVMLSCRYHKLSTSRGKEGTCIPVRTGLQATAIFLQMPLAAWIVSSALAGQPHSGRTLCSSGWNSIRSVSKTTLSVSTSSPSLVKAAMSPRRAPEATEAGYSLAKLRRPRMAARRSSRRVALANRLLRVLIVSVAVCLGGAWASSTRIILGDIRGDYGLMTDGCAGNRKQ